MKILVLIKEVPVVSDIHIDKSTFTVDRSQAGQMMNPSDKHALWAGITLAKEQGNSTVTALSMGPDHCESILRDAIALGANDAVRITDSSYQGADTLVTAHVLKAAIDHLGPFDCIFCGDAAIDGATGQIAGKLGALLHIGVLSHASQIISTDTGLTIQRKSSTGFEEIAADYPLICSVREDANTPGNIMIKGRMASKKAVIPVLSNEDLNLSADELTSPSRVIALFPPAAPKQGTLITGATTEAAAKALFYILLEHRYV